MSKDQVLVNRGEIGPFPGNVKPARPGMYKRITRKGNVVWSYFGSDFNMGWGLFSGSKAKALRNADKRSKHQNLRWIGREK